jgi:predicted metal-dependent HD superfamily phosphohydrolase/8-oxo-dGTP pyrophosphatase MutT (NUDIX family)
VLYPLSYEGDANSLGAPPGACEPGGHRIDRMPVYIDPPLWPAHGTRFSHLVSDTSYDELHAFADRLGVARRAFDRDHYDVRASLYEDAVVAGAVPVDARELTRLLLRSGLRVPARARPEKLAGTLRRRWEAHFPALPGLGAELVERWGEAHRHYHDRSHLLAVLEALDHLVPESGVPAAGGVHEALLLAAWFHDAVYRGRPGDDERDSAALARERLGAAGVPEDLAAEVERLVLLTLDHAAAPGDEAGALLLDADLAVLGADPGAYAAYTAGVRREYAHVPEELFAAGRLGVLEGLWRRQRLYRTPAAQRRWGARAARNLEHEIARLRAAAGGSSSRVPADVAVLTITAVCFLDDDGALLTVRKRGTDRFMLVGGKLEPGEAPAAAAVREAEEEVGLRVGADRLRLLGQFESPAANEAATWVRCTVFTAPLTGRPEPLAEIEELRRLPLDDASVAALPDDLAPLLREHVIPALRRSPAGRAAGSGSVAPGAAGSR